MSKNIYAIGKKNKSLLYLYGEELIFLCTDDKRLMNDAVARVKDGDELNVALLKDADTMPADVVQTIEHLPGEEGLIVRPRSDTNHKMLYCLGFDDIQAVQPIAVRAGMMGRPRTRPATILEVLLCSTSVILMMIGAFAAIALMLALNWEEGGGDTERYGRARATKRFFVMVFETIGETGVLAISLVALAGVVGWLILQIARRPVVTYYARS